MLTTLLRRLAVVKKKSLRVEAQEYGHIGLRGGSDCSQQGPTNLALARKSAHAIICVSTSFVDLISSSRRHTTVINKR